MGKPISLWLAREMENAGKIWNDQKILAKINAYRVAREESVPGYYSCVKNNVDHPQKGDQKKEDKKLQCAITKFKIL